MGDPIRVLHVDDDPEYTALTAKFLEREDDRLSVDTVPGATEGLRRVERRDYECVVSDFDMPGTNGIEFLETIRSEWPDLPFILFTGRGSEEIASDAISAGVTDYLEKRNGTEQFAILANRIANLVEGRRSRRALAERRRRLETLISNLPGVVYRCRNEPDWPMEYVEGECEKLLGCSAAALERGDVLFGRDLVHDHDYDRIWETIQDALDRDDPYEVTYRIVDDDGDAEWVWERGRGVYAADGSLEALEGFITDRARRRRPG